MKRLLFVLVLFLSSLYGISLKEKYDQAGSYGEFDKYIELETGVIYTGGLYIGSAFNPLNNDFIEIEEKNVKIIGNGAMIDLQGEILSLAYCEKILEIEDCVILNGDVRFRGMHYSEIDRTPEGQVSYVTFYKNDDYGIRLYGTGEGIELNNNLFVSAKNTGYDWLYTNGTMNDWLPTGTNIAFSVQIGAFGTPYIHNNFSNHHITNHEEIDSLRHFSILCEYG